MFVSVRFLSVPTVFTDSLVPVIKDFSVPVPVAWYYGAYLGIASRPQQGAKNGEIGIRARAAGSLCTKFHIVRPSRDG